MTTDWPVHLCICASYCVSRISFDACCIRAKIYLNDSCRRKLNTGERDFGMHSRCPSQCTGTRHNAPAHVTLKGQLCCVQKGEIFDMLYAFFWVIPRRLNFIKFGRRELPRRNHTTFRRRWEFEIRKSSINLLVRLKFAVEGVKR
jgi:hypothetical protein